MRRVNKQIFPPGYEYQAECKRILAFYSLAVLYSFRFLGDYYRTYRSLFDWLWAEGQQEAQYMLRPGAQMVPFLEILGPCFLLFIPLLLALGTEAILHYIYYTKLSKSILLVRRLPQKGFLWRTCLAGPLLGAVISLVTMGVLYLLYYGFYICFTPEKCLL